jgi:DNA polymerase-3 subunit epsilon
MALQLARPIAFFDLETTGVNLSTDRIIEVAIIEILQDGTRQVKRKLLNPGIPIPPETTAIHGITDEMVKDAPSFKQCGNELKQFIE